MAKIVHLQPDAPLPDDTSFVIVKRRPTGEAYDITIWTDPAIAYDTKVSPLVFAIQRANEEADRRGLTVVYVQEHQG
jgi:hypothetical protein